MRIPIGWLRDYVEFDATPEELADKLTFSGLEVENIELVGSSCDDVVVGEILAIDAHPNADKLQLCTVDAGGEQLRVVCGAPGVKVGDKAPFAGIGVTLPNGMKVKKSKIRGETSYGMLCAEDEVGVSDDHAALMSLPADAAPGDPLSSVIGPPEHVLVVEVTPNRPDCLSMIGVAREVAALFNTSLKMPSVELTQSGSPVEDCAQVNVDDVDGCPRYTARALSGVAIAPSPSWMQSRLMQCGVKPINNVVDITNYVLLEYGHPLHAFDRTFLHGGQINVRRALPNEKMATLDGVDREVGPDMLVIADGEGPVAIAGVMGGAGSEIRDETSEVLLESACFKASDIRATSLALGLSTESSYRFERGVNVETVDDASIRAAALMVEHAGAVVSKGVIDVYPVSWQSSSITCRHDHVRRLIGVDISDTEIVSLLESLQLRVESGAGGVCTVEVPSFRSDLEIEADIIEEIARIHGLDKIHERAPHGEIVVDVDDSPTRAMCECRSVLVGLGLNEIMNYSFVSERLLDLFGSEGNDRRIVLPNPVSEEQSILRPSLVPQVMASLGNNKARQLADAKLFEMGRTFCKDSEGVLCEEERLCIGLMGAAGRDWAGLRRDVDGEEMFGWAKGILDSLCAGLRSSAVSFEAIDCAWASPGSASAVVHGGRRIGIIGIVSGSICEEWRISGPVAVLEVGLSALLEHVFDVPVAAPLAVYPAVERDMAIIVDLDVRNGDVLNIIEKNAPAELTGVRLFDIYTGNGVRDNKKSLAYSFTYRSLVRTLTDEEANELHESVKDNIIEELNAEVRES